MFENDSHSGMYFQTMHLQFDIDCKTITPFRNGIAIIYNFRFPNPITPLLFVRAIRFSTDFFLPDVTPPHLERWEFAIIRIRDAPSHVIFPGPPENSGTKGGGHEGQV